MPEHEGSKTACEQHCPFHEIYDPIPGDEIDKVNIIH